jgi:hypothetical protein
VFSPPGTSGIDMNSPKRSSSVEKVASIVSVTS